MVQATPRLRLDAGCGSDLDRDYLIGFASGLGGWRLEDRIRCGWFSVLEEMWMEGVAGKDGVCKSCSWVGGGGGDRWVEIGIGIGIGYGVWRSLERERDGSGSLWQGGGERYRHLYSDFGVWQLRNDCRTVPLQRRYSEYGGFVLVFRKRDNFILRFYEKGRDICAFSMRKIAFFVIIQFTLLQFVKSPKIRK